MRLLQRGRAAVTLENRTLLAAVRPLNGLLAAHRWGEYVQDMLRLLLPCDALIAPGDTLRVNGAPYVCVAVRSLLGHLQADVRRCAG